MPSTVKIKVIEARDLPVMNKTSKLTDAFVEVKFGTHTFETKVIRKELNPHWDQDFRVEILDDSVLQDEMVMFRVIDKDQYTSDDPIGSVYCSLNPLLHHDDGKSQLKSMWDATHTVPGEAIQGWFPIYDTLQGVRGELKLAIRVDFYENENPFKDSSASVHFFSSSHLDANVYEIQHTAGFVEELVVHTDPEYDFIDNFRTARKSNESRQTLLYRMSNQVRRQIGKKILEIGCNAVLGYHQHFDIEGDSGLVARGTGTACVVRFVENSRLSQEPRAFPEPAVASLPAPSSPPSVESPALLIGAHRSPAAMDLSPAGNPGGIVATLDGKLLKRKEPFLKVQPGAHSEVLLLTISSLPYHVGVRFGGVVCARSVKYLGRLAAKLADQETRDQWWEELRLEVKSHARALQCRHILGYRENCVVQDDVCILSASGTAVIIKDSPAGKSVRSGIALALASSVRRTSSVPNLDGPALHELPPAQPGESPGAHSPMGARKSFFADEEGIVVVGVVDAASPPSNDAEEDSESDISLDANHGSSPESERVVNPFVLHIPRKSLAFRKESGSQSSVPSTGAGDDGLGPGGAQVGEDLGPVAAEEEERREARKAARRRRRLQDEAYMVYKKTTLPCSMCHVPHRNDVAPFSNMRLVPCGICRSKWVPEVLLSTTEPPPSLPVAGKGVLVEARVCKDRQPGSRDSREQDASLVSETLVFLELEMHRQLMLKIKALGLNCAFSLHSQVFVGPELVIGVTTATAMFALALPPPAVLRISRNTPVLDAEDQSLIHRQEEVEHVACKNREKRLNLAMTVIDMYHNAVRDAITEAIQVHEQEQQEKAKLKAQRRKARARQVSVQYNQDERQKANEQEENEPDSRDENSPRNLEEGDSPRGVQESVQEVDGATGRRVRSMWFGKRSLVPIGNRNKEQKQGVSGAQVLSPDLETGKQKMGTGLFRKAKPSEAGAVSANHQGDRGETRVGGLFRKSKTMEHAERINNKSVELADQVPASEALQDRPARATDPTSSVAAESDPKNAKLAVSMWQKLRVGRAVSRRDTPGEADEAELVAALDGARDLTPAVKRRPSSPEMRNRSRSESPRRRVSENAAYIRSRQSGRAVGPRGRLLSRMRWKEPIRKPGARFGEEGAEVQGTEGEAKGAGWVHALPLIARNRRPEGLGKQPRKGSSGYKRFSSLDRRSNKSEGARSDTDVGAESDHRPNAVEQGHGYRGDDEETDEEGRTEDVKRAGLGVEGAKTGLGISNLMGSRRQKSRKAPAAGLNEGNSADGEPKEPFASGEEVQQPSTSEKARDARGIGLGLGLGKLARVAQQRSRRGRFEPMEVHRDSGGESVSDESLCEGSSDWSDHPLDRRRASRDDRSETSSSSESSSSSSSSSSSEDELDEEEAKELLKEIRGNKKVFVMEVDDEIDEDTMLILADELRQEHVVSLYNCSTVPSLAPRHLLGGAPTTLDFHATAPGRPVSTQLVVLMHREQIDRGRASRLNYELHKIFVGLYNSLTLKLSQGPFARSAVSGIRVQVSLPVKGVVELALYGLAEMQHGAPPSPAPISSRDSLSSADLDGAPVSESGNFGIDLAESTSAPVYLGSDLDLLPPSALVQSSVPGHVSNSNRMLSRIRRGSPLLKGFSFQLPPALTRHISVPMPSLPAGLFPTYFSHRRGGLSKHGATGSFHDASSSPLDPVASSLIPQYSKEALVRLMHGAGELLDPEQLSALQHVQWMWEPKVTVTPLACNPNKRVVRYVGRLSLHFIKESWAVRQGGGLGRFFNQFMSETIAVARAHVASLGGNALLSYRVVSNASPGKMFKNQVYYLISMSGDVALVENA